MDKSITIDTYHIVINMENETQYGILKSYEYFQDKETIKCNDLLQFVYDVVKKQPWFGLELDYIIFEGSHKNLIKHYALPDIWKDE